MVLLLTNVLVDGLYQLQLHLLAYPIFCITSVKLGILVHGIIWSEVQWQ